MARIVPVVPTLMVAVMLAVLVSLGLWQLDRMHWKEEMLARYRANSVEAAAPLPRSIADPEALAFRTVLLDCAFEGEAVLSPGGNDAGKAGNHVYALCREEGRPDRVVVDLGWVAFQAERPAVEGLAARIEGVVRPWADHTAMEKLSGSGRVEPDSFATESPVAPVFVQAERIVPQPESAEAFPETRPSPVRPDAIPNNHRSYAIQWFLFAATLLAIYGVYVYRWRRLQQ